METSSTKEALRRGIGKHIGMTVDDGAVSHIIRTSMAKVPDLSDEELEEIAEDRAAYLRFMMSSSKQVPSPVGWLITYIPQAVSTEAVSAIRERKRKQTEELERLTRELEELKEGEGN